MTKNKTAVYLIVGIFLMMSLVFGGKSYSSLSKMNAEVDKSWTQVEKEYEQRMELISNLLNTVNGKGIVEEGILSAVVEAHVKAKALRIDMNEMTQESLDAYDATNQGLSVALSKLSQLAKNNPDLQGNQAFTQVHSQMLESNKKIASERTGYNEKAGNLNATIEIIPYNVVAKLAGLHARPLFSEH